MAVAAASHPRGDDAQAEPDHRLHVDAGPREHFHVVGLILLGNGHLDECLELGSVTAAARGVLDERLDVREPEDGRQ